MERLNLDLYNKLISEGYEYLSIMNIEKLAQGHTITKIILAPLKTMETYIGNAITGINDGIIKRIILNNDDSFQLYVTM